VISGGAPVPDGHPLGTLSVPDRGRATHGLPPFPFDDLGDHAVIHEVVSLLGPIEQTLGAEWVHQPRDATRGLIERFQRRFGKERMIDAHGL